MQLWSSRKKLKIISESSIKVQLHKNEENPSRNNYLIVHTQQFISLEIRFCFIMKLLKSIIK